MVPVAKRVATLSMVYLLLATSTGAVQRSTDSPVERGRTELTQTLVEARAQKLSKDELATTLSRNRKLSLRELFETLRLGRYAVRVEDRGEQARRLTPEERRGLLGTFGLLPWSDVRQLLEDVRADQPEDSHRIVVLAILAASGTQQELRDVLRWSTPSETEARASRPVQSAFGRALGALLEREPKGLSRVPDLYSAAQLSLVPTLISTLGKIESEASLTALSKLLGKVPRADALVLSEISHLASAVPHPIEQSTRDRVRAYLDSADHSLQIEGLLACSRLEDDDAVSKLIELLSHQNKSIRKSALASLKEITSQLYGYEAADWLNWQSKVQSWRKNRLPELLNQVAASSPSVASRAVLECSKQRIFRHELAPKLAQCLRRTQEDLVILTCAALGHLGSPLVTPELAHCLDHPSSDVRRAALLALRRITGENHGEEARAWADAGW